MSHGGKTITVSPEASRTVEIQYSEQGDWEVVRLMCLEGGTEYVII